MYMERVTYAANGVAVEYLEAVWRGDCYDFKVTPHGLNSQVASSRACYLLTQLTCYLVNKEANYGNDATLFCQHQHV